MLAETFKEYIKRVHSEFLWIRNPFKMDNIPGTLTNNEKEPLI